MNLLRGLALHVGLLACAVVAALVFWLRDETPDLDAEQTVQVWGGKAKAVEEISWESDKLKVKLVSRRDDQGRYFVGTVDQEVAHVKRAPADSDAGTVTDRKRESTQFISVGAADKLVDRIAPLKAYRAIGKVEEARAEEFGLKEPEGTLRVTIAGQPHSLELGSTAPGGQDYYARQAETGEVFAIPAEIARSLMSADSRLLERDLHGWDDEEATRVIVSAGDARRELFRLEGKKQAWAGAARATEQDETAGNWMTKLGRVRIMEYVEKPGPATPVVKVEYFAGREPLGFLELSRLPGKEGKADYLVRTEYTRWHAKLFRTSAEQVEQDLSSVLR
jgi:hypothetical protein